MESSKGLFRGSCVWTDEFQGLFGESFWNLAGNKQSSFDSFKNCILWNVSWKKCILWNLSCRYLMHLMIFHLEIASLPETNELYLKIGQNPKERLVSQPPPFFRGENVSFMECKKHTCRKLTYPLKIDGWKMKNPFEMVPFQVTFVSFQGCTISKQLKSLQVWERLFQGVIFFDVFDAAHLVLCQSFGSN